MAPDTSDGAGEGDEDEKVSIGAKVDPEFKRAIRTLAGSRDMSMSEFVRDALYEKYERETDDSTMFEILGLEVGLEDRSTDKGNFREREIAD
jgi:hypothetical protein